MIRVGADFDRFRCSDWQSRSQISAPMWRMRSRHRLKWTQAVAVWCTQHLITFQAECQEGNFGQNILSVFLCHVWITSIFFGDEVDWTLPAPGTPCLQQDDTVRTKEGLDDAAGVAVVFDEDDEDEAPEID